ncbi:hypothetical protein KAFR_0E03120 [Kazachstania africana CBS 2517]|uniref:AB hydrolase-1 domain-containing protein n=1 Tax=Kazachstania africana (strain ATCC 22294 / BCRC 22015 / CBS 2517 / CECT 1963 / NBRC 1671 / NRRL Y-8276) TaxID=1071382 RepID=H2AVR4_KAZAF|nr:hypothetical protein KAFR_0E03120 [Kazachstania africana CBS 2517]CCF58464.1 hypothetical protein KAFR_0E03120 [Kazachstania africana CBS 2517]
MSANDEDLIKLSCDLKDQPLSGKSIHDIIESYGQDSKLLEKMNSPNAADDFHLKYISDHEDYMDVQGFKIRLCHNMQNIVHDSVYLMLPGLGGNMDQYIQLLRLIDKCNQSFVSIDPPDFTSDKALSNYSMYNIAKLYEETLSRLVGTSKFKLNIVGHSLGTYISIHFYHLFNYKYNVEKLILLTPPMSDRDLPIYTRVIRSTALYAIFTWPWTFDYLRDWLKLPNGEVEPCFYNKNDDENETLHYIKLFQFYLNLQSKLQNTVGYILGWESVDWNAISDILNQEGNNTTVFVIRAENDIVAHPEMSDNMFKKFMVPDDRKKVDKYQPLLSYIVSRSTRASLPLVP